MIQEEDNMQLTISGKEFFHIDDKISAIHYTPAREKYVLPCDAFEIWYVAHGSGLLYFDKHEIKVNVGDIFLIEPNKEHFFMSVQDPEELHVELYHCKFDPVALYGIPTDCSSIYNLAIAFSFHHQIFGPLRSIPYLILADTNDNNIRNILIRLIHEYTSRPTGYGNMMLAYLNELITLLFRKYEEKMTGIKSGIPENNNPVITLVIRYIQYNIHNELSLEGISNYFYMSNSYLSKLFKKHTGVTILDYIQKLRIEKACDLLKNTDRTIEGIADRIGYSSNSYFQKIFKSKIGMTMYEYRKKYRDTFNFPSSDF